MDKDLLDLLYFLEQTAKGKASTSDIESRLKQATLKGLDNRQIIESEIASYGWNPADYANDIERFAALNNPYKAEMPLFARGAAGQDIPAPETLATQPKPLSAAINQQAQKPAIIPDPTGYKEAQPAPDNFGQSARWLASQAVGELNLPTYADKRDEPNYVDPVHTAAVRSGNVGLGKWTKGRFERYVPGSMEASEQNSMPITNIHTGKTTWISDDTYNDLKESYARQVANDLSRQFGYKVTPEQVKTVREIGFDQMFRREFPAQWDYEETKRSAYTQYGVDPDAGLAENYGAALAAGLAQGAVDLAGGVRNLIIDPAVRGTQLAMNAVGDVSGDSDLRAAVPDLIGGYNKVLRNIGAEEIDPTTGRQVPVDQSAALKRSIFATTGLNPSQLAPEESRAAGVAGEKAPMFTETTQILGRSVPMMLGGGEFKVAGKTFDLGATALGALVMGGQSKEDAQRFTDDPFIQAAAAAGGMLAGAFEGVGGNKLEDFIDLATPGNSVGSVAARFMLNSTKEGGQEGLSQIITNLPATALYDQSRSLLEGVDKSIEGGFSTGVLMGGGPAAISGTIAGIRGLREMEKALRNRANSSPEDAQTLNAAADNLAAAADRVLENLSNPQRGAIEGEQAQAAQEQVPVEPAQPIQEAPVAAQEEVVTTPQETIAQEQVVEAPVVAPELTQETLSQPVQANIPQTILTSSGEASFDMAIGEGYRVQGTYTPKTGKPIEIRVANDGTVESRQAGTNKPFVPTRKNGAVYQMGMKMFESIPEEAIAANEPVVSQGGPIAPEQVVTKEQVSTPQGFVDKAVYQNTSGDDSDVLTAGGFAAKDTATIEYADGRTEQVTIETQQLGKRKRLRVFGENGKVKPLDGLASGEIVSIRKAAPPVAPEVAEGIEPTIESIQANEFSGEISTQLSEMLAPPIALTGPDAESGVAPIQAPADRSVVDIIGRIGDVRSLARQQAIAEAQGQLQTAFDQRLTIKWFSSFMDFVNKSFGASITLSTDQGEFDAAVANFNTTNNQSVNPDDLRAFVSPDGKSVYINPSKATVGTLFHEYTTIWLAAMKNSSPVVYTNTVNRFKTLAKTNPYLKKKLEEYIAGREAFNKSRGVKQTRQQVYDIAVDELMQQYMAEVLGVTVAVEGIPGPKLFDRLSEGAKKLFGNYPGLTKVMTWVASVFKEMGKSLFKNAESSVLGGGIVGGIVSLASGGPLLAGVIPGMIAAPIIYHFFSGSKKTEIDLANTPFSEFAYMLAGEIMSEPDAFSFQTGLLSGSYSNTTSMPPSLSDIARNAGDVYNTLVFNVENMLNMSSIAQQQRDIDQQTGVRTPDSERVVPVESDVEEEELDAPDAEPLTPEAKFKEPTQRFYITRLKDARKYLRSYAQGTSNKAALARALFRELPAEIVKRTQEAVWGSGYMSNGNQDVQQSVLQSRSGALMLNFHNFMFGSFKSWKALNEKAYERAFTTRMLKLMQSTYSDTNLTEKDSMAWIGHVFSALQAVSGRNDATYQRSVEAGIEQSYQQALEREVGVVISTNPTSPTAKLARAKLIATYRAELESQLSAAEANGNPVQIVEAQKKIEAFDSKIARGERSVADVSKSIQSRLLALRAKVGQPVPLTPKKRSLMADIDSAQKSVRIVSSRGASGNSTQMALIKAQADLSNAIQALSDYEVAYEKRVEALIASLERKADQIANAAPGEMEANSDQTILEYESRIQQILVNMDLMRYGATGMSTIFVDNAGQVREMRLDENGSLDTPAVSLMAPMQGHPLLTAGSGYTQAAMFVQQILNKGQFDSYKQMHKQMIDQQYLVYQGLVESGELTEGFLVDMFNRYAFYMPLNQEGVNAGVQRDPGQRNDKLFPTITGRGHMIPYTMRVNPMEELIRRTEAASKRMTQKFLTRELGKIAREVAIYMGDNPLVLSMTQKQWDDYGAKEGMWPIKYREADEDMVLVVNGGIPTRSVPGAFNVAEGLYVALTGTTPPGTSNAVTKTINTMESFLQWPIISHVAKIVSGFGNLMRFTAIAGVTFVMKQGTLDPISTVRAMGVRSPELGRKKYLDYLVNYAQSSALIFKFPLERLGRWNDELNRAVSGELDLSQRDSWTLPEWIAAWRAYGASADLFDFESSTETSDRGRATVRTQDDLTPGAAEIFEGFGNSVAGMARMAAFMTLMKAKDEQGNYVYAPNEASVIAQESATNYNIKGQYAAKLSPIFFLFNGIMANIRRSVRTFEIVTTGPGKGKRMLEYAVQAGALTTLGLTSSLLGYIFGLVGDDDEDKTAGKEGAALRQALATNTAARSQSAMLPLGMRMPLAPEELIYYNIGQGIGNIYLAPEGSQSYAMGNMFSQLLEDGLKTYTPPGLPAAVVKGATADGDVFDHLKAGMIEGFPTPLGKVGVALAFNYDAFRERPISFDRKGSSPYDYNPAFLHHQLSGTVVDAYKEFAVGINAKTGAAIPAVRAAEIDYLLDNVLTGFGQDAAGMASFYNYLALPEDQRTARDSWRYAPIIRGFTFDPLTEASRTIKKEDAAYRAKKEMGLPRVEIDPAMRNANLNNLIRQREEQYRKKK